MSFGSSIYNFDRRASSKEEQKKKSRYSNFEKTEQSHKFEVAFDYRDTLLEISVHICAKAISSILWKEKAQAERAPH